VPVPVPVPAAEAAVAQAAVAQAAVAQAPAAEVPVPVPAAPVTSVEATVADGNWGMLIRSNPKMAIQILFGTIQTSITRFSLQVGRGILRRCCHRCRRSKLSYNIF